MSFGGYQGQQPDYNSILNELRQQLHRVAFDTMFRNISDLCFEACGTPGALVTGSDTSKCLTQCVDQYLQACQVVANQSKAMEPEIKAKLEAQAGL